MAIAVASEYEASEFDSCQGARFKIAVGEFVTYVYPIVIGH
jgi:hypothetical protein